MQFDNSQTYKRYGTGQNILNDVKLILIIFVLDLMSCF